MECEYKFISICTYKLYKSHWKRDRFWNFVRLYSFFFLFLMRPWCRCVKCTHSWARGNLNNKATLFVVVPRIVLRWCCSVSIVSFFFLFCSSLCASLFFFIFRSSVCLFFSFVFFCLTVEYSFKKFSYVPLCAEIDTNGEYVYFALKTRKCRIKNYEICHLLKNWR